jgi:hypothetical protein
MTAQRRISPLGAAARGGLAGIAGTLTLSLLDRMLGLWEGKRRDGSRIAHPPRMLDPFILLLRALRAMLSSHADLVAENPLRRHQLAVLTRPGRKRPPLRARDTRLWVPARRFCPDWRRRLALVPPDTVVRWHRGTWRSSGGGGPTAPWAAPGSAPSCGN